MADRGTTGGYTKIATVVTADLAVLAQAAPGDRLRFAAIAVDEAQALLRLERAKLDRIGSDAPPPMPAPEIFEEDSGSSLAAAAYADLAGALAARRAEPTERGDVVRAAMPGLVVSVGVAPGDAIAAGQPLLVVEAMKMQSPVRAPRGGRVARVLVGPGMAVEGGAALVELEGPARWKD
jgi:biotin carboxyl carrier protein